MDRSSFFEIDNERFKALTDHAGLFIMKQSKKVMHREWYFYFKGVRPVLRLFLNYQIIYKLSRVDDYLNSHT